jgi:hypothetical protein
MMMTRQKNTVNSQRAWLPRTKIPATGSCRKDERKSTYPAGKYRKSLEHGSSIPAGNCPDFFRWIPGNLLCSSAGTGLKSSEKKRKISGQNTASTKSPELPRIGRFRAGLFDLGVSICRCSVYWHCHIPGNLLRNFSILLNVARYTWIKLHVKFVDVIGII